MKRFIVRIVSVAVVTTLFVFASQASAVAASFPEKGKVINWIVQFGAGTGADMTARTMKPGLEKALGVPIVIINKPGGGGMVGITELVRSKPDGYTIGVSLLPTLIPTYLDPSRGATYGRKDFKLVANIVVDPNMALVMPNSPFKTLKDMIDAGKSNPGKIKVTTSSLLSVAHLLIVKLEQMTGAKFSTLFYDQAGEQRSALLGGHVDVEMNTVSDAAKDVVGGTLRALGIASDTRNKYVPNVQPFKEQNIIPNFPVSAAWRGILVPAGTPDDIVKILAAAVKTALADPETISMFDRVQLETRYMDGKEYDDTWAAGEESVRVAIESVRSMKK